MNYNLAQRAGLADAGKDELGQQLWIGTSEQWAEYEKLKSQTIKIPVRQEMELPQGFQGEL
jgi:hypothetical protein